MDFYTDPKISKVERKTVCTRLDHVCFACLRAFVPKTYMEVTSCATKTPAKIYSIYNCLVCVKILNKFFRDKKTVFEGWLVEEMKCEKFNGTPEDYLEEKEFKEKYLTITKTVL